MNNTDFYTSNLSYSQLRTFTINTWEWQNQKLLWIYDNTTWVASATWSILHKFVEKYLNTWNIEEAINYCYKCVYDWPDWKTYIIDPEILDLAKSSFEDIKQHFKTKVVDFKKTWSNEKIMKDVKSWIEAFLSEQVDYGDLLGVEKSMTHDAFDILWGNIEVRSPIQFTAITDEICRTNKEKTLLIEWELQTIPVWSIFMEDTKFKASHSEMNAEDPTYIFQAFFNYYCVKAEYWESPKFMIFREIKASKNTDWSSQHQTITIPFFGDSFETYKVFFWRYILETFERIKIIQERDFIFNIFDQYNSWKEWEKQKAYYLWVPVWQLKNKIAMTQKNKIASNVPIMGDRDPFKNARQLKNWEVVEDLNSIENRIRVAFQNFWIKVQFEKKIDWYSYDQYLFTPARWITMFKIKSHLPEIIQALEVEKWLRIEAPVIWTKFIWVEIPKEERRFAQLEKLKKTKAPILPIWMNIGWEYETIDLSDSNTPHIIVAWQTWSWKSEFLKTAIYSLKGKWDLYLIDPKKVWLIKYKSFATKYETNIVDIAWQLGLFLAEMYSTYDTLANLWYESIYDANKNWQNFKSTFIIIDELASLVYDPFMWKDIIATIWQLANLGRAAGFNLIIATQRPDIKVIPGNIKANISTRICFQLATKVDSKVVIDEEWAEQLLGKWDMLFMNNGIKRLQWFYI